MLKLVSYSLICFLCLSCVRVKAKSDYDTPASQTTSCIEIVDTIIDDSNNGNNNGVLELGETVNLFVVIKNNCNFPLSGNATLAALDSSISITQNTVFYDTIGVNETGVANMGFELTCRAPKNPIPTLFNFMNSSDTAYVSATHPLLPCIEWHKLVPDISRGDHNDTLVVKLSACNEIESEMPNVLFEIVSMRPCRTENIGIPLPPISQTQNGYGGIEKQQFFGVIPQDHCSESSLLCHHPRYSGAFVLAYDRDLLHRNTNGNMVCLELGIQRWVTWSDNDHPMYPNIPWQNTCQINTNVGGRSDDVDWWWVSLGIEYIRIAHRAIGSPCEECPPCEDCP